MDYLEIIERPDPTNSEPRRVYHSYQGQLQLSVKVAAGMLSVCVIQAKDLRSKSADFHCYAKVSLYPEGRKRTPGRTAVIRNNSAPCWDAQFAFEMLPEDWTKRVVISLWRVDEETEQVGCVSFGLHSVEADRTIANGTYYLLPEQVGKHKHLKVTSRRSRSQRTCGQQRAAEARVSTLDAPWRDSYVFTIPAGDEGYGFTLGGHGPVLVSKVKPGSPAEGVGLQAGDRIVTVNQVKVTDYTSHSIANLIRQSGGQAKLGVQRFKHVTVPERSPLKPRTHTAPWWQPCYTAYSKDVPVMW